MPLPHKKIKRPERQRLILICSTLLLGFAGWLVLSPYGAVRYYRLQREVRAVKDDNQRITAENKALAKEIHRLRHDRSYQEEVARRDFGLMKRNEMVFDFSGEKKKGKEEE